jgi:regulator of chromosome condensation
MSPSLRVISPPPLIHIAIRLHALPLSPSYSTPLFKLSSKDLVLTITSEGAPKKTPTSKEAAAPRNTGAAKRKQDDHDGAPTAKRAKQTAAEEEATPAPRAAKPKATPRPKAIPKPRVPKTVVNDLRYTEKLNVYVCGEGSSGELGLGSVKNAIDVKRPRLNPFLAADTVGVVRVATGGMHCLALTHDNKILSWGVNDQGALGRDTTWSGDSKMKDADAGSDSDSEDDDSGLNPLEATPTAISSEYFPEGTKFVDIAAGDSVSFALTTTGLVYGWGTFRVSLSQVFHLDLH